MAYRGEVKSIDVVRWGEVASDEQDKRESVKVKMKFKDMRGN